VAESLSLAAFWLALLVTAAGVVFHWAHLLGLRVVMRRLATEAGQGPVLATLERGVNGLAEPAGRWGLLTAYAATALFAVWAVARWQAAGHPPWSNMYEFTIAFAGGITACYVAFERLYGQHEGQAGARTLGALVQPVVLAMLVVTAAFFPSEVRPLVPALQNNTLLAVHVATMIAAYAALSVSFAAALLYLAQGGTRRRFMALPRARTLDDIAYRSVMIGFPLLALGIALGAYWANSAWGRYWGWDPKETSALGTWLIYGVYLHMRGMRKWSGTRSAWVLVAGFGAVLFTYFAVNLLIPGLHSYAGV
jgi:cytochrome c-type biogenesis protein CcsB